MRNRFLVMTALGLVLGLSACDQSAEEQAQTPREPEQQRQLEPSAPQQGQLPEPPMEERQQPPQTAPSEGSSTGTSSGPGTQ